MLGYHWNITDCAQTWGQRVTWPYRPNMALWLDVTCSNPANGEGSQLELFGSMAAGVVDWMRFHDDVIKWKQFPRYWPFVRGIHRSPVNSPHKVQWRGALMFSLICVWINGWVNTSEASDLRRNRAHYDVIIICLKVIWPSGWQPRRWFDESAKKYTSCRGNRIFRNELMLFTVPNKHQAISNHRADMPTLLPVVTWTVSQNILRCSFFMFFNCLHWWPFRLVSLKFVLMS